MNPEPLQFGDPGREMVGMLSRPSAGAGRSPYLFFNPYGQEAIRAAPLYRALAERLMRAGHPVLRFDYHGTGNSSGDESSLTLDAMVADALAASDRLRQSGVQRQVWFGLSLGATIAARAALAAPMRPGRLILWQPVTDGADYCNRMIEQHRNEMADELQSDWAHLRATMGFKEPTVPGHVLGFAIGPELAAELKALRPLPVEALLGTDTVVDCATVSPDAVGLQAAGGTRWRPLTVEEPINWLAGEADSTSLVPRQIVDLLLGGRTSP